MIPVSATEGGRVVMRCGVRRSGLVVVLSMTVCNLLGVATTARAEGLPQVAAPGTRIAGEGWVLTVPALGQWIQFGAAPVWAALYEDKAECAYLSQAPAQSPYAAGQASVEVCAVKAPASEDGADPAAALLRAERDQVRKTAAQEGQRIRDEHTTVIEDAGRTVHRLSFQLRWRLVGNVPIYVDTALSCPPGWRPGQPCFRVSYTRYAPTWADPGAAVTEAFTRGTSAD